MSYAVIASSTLLSALTIPLILQFAYTKSYYDILDWRKSHNGNIPRLGGVGIFISVTFVMLALVLFHCRESLHSWPREPRLYGQLRLLGW